MDKAHRISAIPNIITIDDTIFPTQDMADTIEVIETTAGNSTTAGHPGAMAMGEPGHTEVTGETRDRESSPATWATMHSKDILDTGGMAINATTEEISILRDTLDNNSGSNQVQMRRPGQ